LGRRSRVEVIREILIEALDGRNKTKIMYRCNLNLKSFNRHLDELLSKGLLVKVKHHSRNGVLYKTSEKGKRLLRALDEAMDILLG